MTAILTAANTWLRDYASDGVPASGANDPDKAEGRTVFGLFDAALTSLIDGVVIGGAVVYSTRALLYADLAHAAEVLGVVYADSTAAQNGIYVKAGISGAGSWSLTNLALPSTYAASLTTINTAITALQAEDTNLQTQINTINTDIRPYAIPNPQSGTTYTIAAADRELEVRFSNAASITVTVPNSLPDGFICTVRQLGTGTVNFVAGSGASLTSYAGYTKTAGRYAAVVLVVTSNTLGTNAVVDISGMGA